MHSCYMYMYDTVEPRLSGPPFPESRLSGIEIL